MEMEATGVLYIYIQIFITRKLSKFSLQLQQEYSVSIQISKHKPCSVYVECSISA